MAIDEKKLIAACKRNDARSQRLLYETYAPKMFSVCLRYAEDREMAYDYLQEGFIKVFSSLSTFGFEGSFEGWMRKIFTHTALEHLRRNDLLKESLDIDDTEDVPDTDSSALENISADELMEIIAELPAGFRTVFNMYAIEGYSHKEIGEALGISESTSRSQFARARRLLQKRLSEI